MFVKNVLILTGLGLFACSSFGGTVLHVSPQGDDAADGSVEHPLATPAGALARLRALRASKDGAMSAAGFQIVLADGLYVIDAPIELSAADSGTPCEPVVWRAAHRAKAVLSGRARLEWKKGADADLLSLLPKVAHDKVCQATIPGAEPLPGFHGGGCSSRRRKPDEPLTLFQCGRRYKWAVWPNRGWKQTGTCLGPQSDTGYSSLERRYTNGTFLCSSERLRQWKREPDLWAHGFWFYDWDDRREEVTAVDPDRGTITVSSHGNPYGFRKGRNYQVFNAFSELDRPGEWAVDRTGRRLVFWPIEDPSKELPELAFVPSVFDVKGAHDIVFDGLVLECSRADALKTTDASRVRLVSSVVRKTGGWGVNVKGGTVCEVVGCDLYALGGGGVRLEGGDWTTLTPCRHRMDNCNVGHFAEVWFSSRPAADLYGVGCEATHNLIHHSPCEGIMFKGNDHRIAFNIVHDVANDPYLNDASAIYACQLDWTTRGTVIEHNLVHWTGRTPRVRPTHAIYIDDYTSGTVIRGNILNRCCWGIHMGGGNGNVMTNNVISVSEMPLFFGSRSGARGTNSFYYSKLVANRALFEKPPWTKYADMLKVLDFKDPVFAHGPLFDTFVDNVAVGCGPDQPIDEAVAEYSRVVPATVLSSDVGFSDYRNLDFSLHPGSPLWKAHGGDTRFREMGLYESPLRVSKPVKFAPGVTLNPATPKREYAAAVVRVDVRFKGELPKGQVKFLEDAEQGQFPHWGHGKLLVNDFGLADDDVWRTFVVRIVPAVTGRATLTFNGYYGCKTAYADISCRGAELKDTSLSTTVGSGPWQFDTGFAYRPPRGDVREPFGVIESFEGRRCLFANLEKGVRQEIDLVKGFPVEITFKARSYLK